MGRSEKLAKEEALWRATNLFWLEGCSAVSIRDLEEELDLRAPAIYRRFKSKDELLAQCIEYYLDTVLADRIKRFLEDSTDPLDGLYDFFTSTLERQEGESRRRGCLLANAAAQAEGQVPEVRAALDRGWRLTEGAFRSQVERAQELGQLDNGLDAGALARSLLMTLQGLLTLMRVDDADLQPGIDATFELLGRPRTSSSKHLRES